MGEEFNWVSVSISILAIAISCYSMGRNAGYRQGKEDGKREALRK